MVINSTLRVVYLTYWNKEQMLYPIIHLKGEDIEVAITHCRNQYSEQYYSFVNGQHTVQGGTHQGAFRQALADAVTASAGSVQDYYHSLQGYRD
jgi:DNA gyrase/topoisomerase IV subunit B